MTVGFPAPRHEGNDFTMAYPTLDNIPDLTLTQRMSARPLTLKLADANAGSFDNSVFESRFDSNAGSSDLYKMSMTQGAIYYFTSSSYFDPYQIVLYDEDGNAMKVTTDEASLGIDNLYGFVAPYSGTLYVDAGFNPGQFYDQVYLAVYEDLKQPNFAGNDYLTGVNVAASTGNDSVIGTAAADYLRGDEGNDAINGADGNDDINGNMGDDTCGGGIGDDWVVGGKDQDNLKGEQGADIVLGNLGSDTCEGGAGNDIVRGGQENDVVLGGSGDDFVSGDKGDDTMTGNEGADMFHTFGEAGIDRVTDFSLAQGDRVQLDPGTTYTVAQSGADTVISMNGGGQMILVGVTMSTLTGAWIFGG